jgi:hypothetical protein
MSQGETAPEPSMDEILSSIRKIIADDETEEPAVTPPDEVASADDDVTVGGDEDDILELTEDDEITAEGVTADGADAGDAVDGATGGGSTVEDDPLDLDDDPADGDTPRLEAVEALAGGGAAAAAPTGDDGAAEIRAPGDALLDDGTTTAANAPLQRLSAAISQGAAIPGGERTIEAFLADLVRPELKGWLDRHLPGLVERIVEREIKKLVRDAQPE